MRTGYIKMPCTGGTEILRNKISSMKLRSKIMAGLLCILLAAMGWCGFFLLSACRKTIIRDVEFYAEQENRTLRDTFVFQTAKLSSESSEIAERAGIQYYFSRLAEKAAKGSEYVLLRDNEVIYNNSGIDAAGVLDMESREAAGQKNEEENAAGKVVHMEDGDFYVSGMTVVIMGKKFIVGVVRDITDSMNMVRLLALRCGLICAGIAAFAILLTILFLRKSLMPIEWLTENARKIASGEYDSRIEWKRRDELGTLGESFNIMAESVKHHICKVETAAKDQNMLLHALAHEMRTPVTAISGYAYVLQYARLSEEQKTEAAVFIYSESLRLERLTKKITELVHMDSAKIEKQTIQAADLFAQLAQIEKSVREKSGENLLYYRCEAGAEIDGDVDLLLMLLTNLIDNAYKAGAEKIVVGFEKGILSVSDDGSGILPEQIEKIMQPFYQGDASRNQQGFGLGLALCQKIAALHGSRLQVSSVVGVGSKFYIRWE